MRRRFASGWLVCLTACVAATLASAAPGPGAPIPRQPAALAKTIVETKADLAQAIDAWRASGDPRPSTVVTLEALYDQRIELLLAGRADLARTTLRLVPARIARVIRTNVNAKRELWRLTPVTHRRRFRTGPALPAATLIRYYREAQRRFGVPWNVLAAVNLVESAFNKLRNNSITGGAGCGPGRRASQ